MLIIVPSVNPFTCGFTHLPNMTPTPTHTHTHTHAHAHIHTGFPPLPRTIYQRKVPCRPTENTSTSYPMWITLRRSGNTLMPISPVKSKKPGTVEPQAHLYTIVIHIPPSQNPTGHSTVSTAPALCGTGRQQRGQGTRSSCIAWLSDDQLCALGSESGCWCSQECARLDWLWGNSQPGGWRHEPSQCGPSTRGRVYSHYCSTHHVWLWPAFIWNGDHMLFYFRIERMPVICV